MKKLFKVHYAFRLSDVVEIEADTADEAEQTVKDMIESCELGNLNEMDIVDDEVWVD